MTSLCEAKQEEAQRRFVQMLPEIERRARLTLRHHDPEAREEFTAEVVGLCWLNYLHCVAEGKTVSSSSLAHYGLLGVRTGRGVCGEDSRDVMARKAQILGRASVESLDAVPMRAPEDPTDSAHDSGWWNRSETLVDRRTWERPFERTRIKHDYGLFLQSGGVTPQETAAFNLLAEGHRTGEAAEKLDVSPGRVCQIKTSIAEKLVRFMGPDVDPNYRALSASGARPD
jgi:DNA-binding CsgD family transcriptional regulator